MQRILSLQILCFLLSPMFCLAKTVEFPVTLDYPLLEALMIQSSYTDADETALLLDEGNGCIKLTLSDPAFSGSENVIYFSTNIFLHVGTPIGGNCFMPYTWEGSIKAAQTPQLNHDSWELTFETVDTTLYSSDGDPIESFNIVWDRIMPLINSHMHRFSVNLAPPVEDLKAFIQPLFTSEAQKEAETFLGSIRPGEVGVEKEGLIATIRGDVIELPGEEEPEPPAELSEAELASFVQLWETWDSLLVYLVSLLSEQHLTEAEKLILIHLLLDTRHEFVTRINDQDVEHDFVREQFVYAWTKLSDIFRNHLLYNPEGAGLAYLSFFTAVDALMVLDELGPTFGIDISRNGLIRLARILGGETLELNYLPDINKTLQQLFEAFPTQDPGASPQKKNTPDARQEQDTSALNFIDYVVDFIFPPAMAGDLPTFSEIQKWQVGRTDVNEYLARVRKLLHSVVSSLAVRKNVPGPIKGIYDFLIPAIAWQESCFRQFVVRDDKLTYLLSYNRSSVGIMQVNERVWRGIYDRQRLRWDINYNVTAGCEIADLYLQKYILPNSGPDILSSEETLSQIIYAMYNGGPSQYPKFMERKEGGELYESDRLFLQKYDWVKSQEWHNIEHCL